MSDGELPAPELPDLEQPPGIKEGVGGGPAFPGAGLPDEDKARMNDASDVMRVGGVALFLAGGALFFAGGLLFAAVSMALSGWMTLGSGIVVGILAQDPPQPFKQIVSFNRRRMWPPELADPVLSRVGILTQQAAFTRVTASGYLDALERLAGAQQAQDFDWAVTHAGVVEECRRALPVNLATTAAALYAAAGSLTGTLYDTNLTPGMGGGRAWIESPGVEDAVVRQSKAAGMTTGETAAAVEWFKSDPTYSGSAASLSEVLAQSANLLYAHAQRLNYFR